MPFVYNLKTNDITMPAGDTGGFSVTVNWTAISDGDVVLFAVFDDDADKDLLKKPVEIENGKAIVRLCNHDTRDIKEGKYNWNLRIITDPEYDSDGNVIVEDCSDNVHTVFNRPPKFNLIYGGGKV